MVEQAAHDSSDECSTHSSLILIIYPSAGIGRQGELKLRWFIIVNVQVVSRILLYVLFILLYFYSIVTTYNRPTSQEVKT